MVLEKIFPRKITSKQILPKLGQRCFPKTQQPTISLTNNISSRTYKELFCPKGNTEKFNWDLSFDHIV